MKKAVSVILAVAIAFCMAFSLSSCSKTSNEMTEENINATVEIVATALKEFDVDTLNKYVDSDTLDYILKFAEDHDQYITLGKAIFANMEIKVDSIDINNKTVTVTVSNKMLKYAASDFANRLLSKYSTFQLLGKLEDEKFLNDSLSELVALIEKSTISTEATVELNIKQGDKNLVLSFDEDAEDAVSGGALSAITGLF